MYLEQKYLLMKYLLTPKNKRVFYNGDPFKDSNNSTSNGTNQICYDNE